MLSRQIYGQILKVESVNLVYIRCMHGGMGDGALSDQ